MKVYLLMSSVSYEGSNVEGVYESKQEAEDIAKRGNAHNEKFPELANDPTDKDWEIYEKREKSWNKRHPVKGGSVNEDYYVNEKTLKRSKQKGGGDV